MKRHMKKNHPGGLNLSHLLLGGAGDAGAGSKWFVLLFSRCPRVFLVGYFFRGAPSPPSLKGCL